MEPLHEALRLIERQAETENALRRTGGIRVTEERELFQLRHALTQYPEPVTAIIEAAARMRRPVDTICVDDVEATLSTTPHLASRSSMQIPIQFLDPTPRN